MDDAKLFMKDNAGPTLKVGKAAERLAEPGLSVEHAAGQLRGLASRKLVWANGGTVGEGKVVHNLFTLWDLAVAKVLSILTVDAAVNDPSILGAVSAQLYSWPDHYWDDRDTRYPSSIRAALAGVARGEPWVCRIDIRRHEETGDKIVQTTLCNAENGIPRFKDADGSLPRLSFTIALQPPFERLLTEPVKAH